MGIKVCGEFYLHTLKTWYNAVIETMGMNQKPSMQRPSVKMEVFLIQITLVWKQIKGQ